MIVLAGEVGLRGLLDALRRPEGERILHRLPPAFRRGFLAWAGEREEAFGSAGVPEGAEPFSEGVFQALWRLGEKAGSGFTVSLEALRPHQYVIELCERLDLNPYRIPGLGYAALRDAPAEDERAAGFLTAEKARVIEGPAGRRYLAPPERGY